MTCLHNHDQILEFLQKIFLKGFQIFQNYLCALRSHTMSSLQQGDEAKLNGLSGVMDANYFWIHDAGGGVIQSNPMGQVECCHHMNMNVNSICLINTA